MAGLQWDRSFALEQSGEELLDLLKSSSISDLEKIKAAIIANDGDAAADAAHSIKGAAASLGVEGLRLLASDIENHGRAGRNADVDVAQLEGLIRELDTLVV